MFAIQLSRKNPDDTRTAGSFIIRQFICYWRIRLLTAIMLYGYAENDRRVAVWS